MGPLTTPKLTNRTTSTRQNHPHHPHHHPTLTHPYAMYWTLNDFFDLIPTHQLAEGYNQMSPYTAHPPNLLYTAARGQGAPERVVQRIFNLTATKNRVSWPQEVGVG